MRSQNAPKKRASLGLRLESSDSGISRTTPLVIFPAGVEMKRSGLDGEFADLGLRAQPHFWVTSEKPLHISCAPSFSHSLKGNPSQSPVFPFSIQSLTHAGRKKFWILHHKIKHRHFVNLASRYWHEHLQAPFLVASPSLLQMLFLRGTRAC